jgi:hypothetical protein
VHDSAPDLEERPLRAGEQLCGPFHARGRGLQPLHAPIARRRQNREILRELAIQDVLGNREVDRAGAPLERDAYQQYHQGIRVFSAVLKVHQNASGEVSAANGDFHPIRTTFDTSSISGA